MTYFIKVKKTNWLHSSFTRPLWLGGNKSASGSWTWADGNVISWVRWAPDALEEEASPRYLLLEPDTGNMTSQAPEDERAYFVCEVEMAGQFTFDRNYIVFNMMTSSNGNIFRVTVPLWGESTGDRWIPLTTVSDAELSCFLLEMAGPFIFISGWLDLVVK